MKKAAFFTIFALIVFSSACCPDAICNCVNDEGTSTDDSEGGTTSSGTSGAADTDDTSGATTGNGSSEGTTTSSSPFIITITNLGPFVDTGINPGDTNFEFLNFTVLSSIDVTARDTYLSFGVDPPPGMEGVNPLQFIDVVRIMDLDTGTTLAGPTSFLSDEVISDDYDLEANVVRTLSFQANIDGAMPAGFQIQACIRYAENLSSKSYFYDNASAEYIPTSALNQAGNSAMCGTLFTTQ